MRARRHRPNTPTLLLSSQNGGETAQTAISYTYDSLYRLTDAVYSNGFEFHYTYDSVGNAHTPVYAFDDA